MGRVRVRMLLLYILDWLVSLKTRVFWLKMTSVVRVSCYIVMTPVYR